MRVCEGGQGPLQSPLLHLSGLGNGHDAVLAMKLLHHAISDGKVETGAQAAAARWLVQPQAVVQALNPRLDRQWGACSEQQPHREVEGTSLWREDSSTFAPAELLSLYSSTVMLLVAAHCQHAARLLTASPQNPNCSS
jgi:hypothetical protein